MRKLTVEIKLTLDTDSMDMCELVSIRESWEAMLHWDRSLSRLAQEIIRFVGASSRGLKRIGASE